MTKRVVFMGTPGFACPALETLARTPGIEVPLVVTQPDRPAGRGRTLQAPPVKAMAETLGLPVLGTASLRTREARQPIVDAAPDLIVVAAFGLILGRSLLELPSRGCVNLHASLLPRYRGANPISTAILNGDPDTGVTLMRMAPGLDTGPMLATIREPILPNDTTESLTARLAGAAAGLLGSHLHAILDGSLAETPQPPGATLTRPLVKADGWIDWRQPAGTIERQVRAMWPWPRAWTTLPGEGLFQIHAARVVAGVGLEPGTATLTRDGPVVSCGQDALLVTRGQLAGRKPLDGSNLGSVGALAGAPVLGQGDEPAVPGPLEMPVAS